MKPPPFWSCGLAWAVVATLLLFPTSRGVVAGTMNDNHLSLLIAVPLTKNNTNVPDPGWIQLAGALLAVDHFNSRDTSVVPELANYTKNCSITFGNVSALDTGTNDKHIAMQDLATVPNAIAGPYNDIPALELSVFATALKIPLVSHSSFDYTLLLPEKHPYFSQVSACPISEMEFVATYLQHTGRNNYIAIVYSSTASVMQKVDILRSLLDPGTTSTTTISGTEDQRPQRQVRTFSYRSVNDQNVVGGRLHDVSIRNAMAKVKETGFRTIVFLPDDIRADAAEMQQAASMYELDQGGHLWVISGGTGQLSTTEQYHILDWSKMNFGPRSFLNGAAYLLPYDGFTYDYLRVFHDAMRHQNKSFVERLEQLTPIPNYFDWSFAKHNETNTLDEIIGTLISWWQGSSYLYDATMAIGIGACQGRAMATNANASSHGIMTGDLLLEGIRSVDFNGASGRLKFRGGISGSRDSTTIPYAVVNLLPGLGENDELLRVTEILDPKTETFMQVAQFVYADGSDAPPILLRDVPEQNYLDCGIRALGLSLMAIALLCVLLATIWIVRHRTHNVVIAAQPPFLYALCLGSAIISLNIYFMSLDESFGWDDSMLDKACVTAVWTNAAGMLLIYGSIFIKHWRVHRLMIHKGKAMSLGIVFPPLAFLICLIIVLQGVWTAAGAYGWERVEIDDVTGESIGQCTYAVAPCLFWTAFFLFVPVALAANMAYKTMGVDDLYSEGKWVLIFILVQFQVYLVGAPVLHILRTLSADGRFIGQTLLIWTVPMSTMGLIVFPKVLLVRKMQKKAQTVTSDAQDRHSHSQDSSESGIATDDGSPAAVYSPRTVPSPRGTRIQIVTFDD